MKTGKLIISILVISGLVIVIAVRLMSNKESFDRELKLISESNSSVPVIVDTVRTQPVLSEFSVDGIFSASKEATVAAELEGKIIAVNINKGDGVAAGQVLAILDNKVLKSQLELAGYNLEKAEKDMQRSEQLVKTDGVTMQQFEDSKKKLIDAQTNLLSAQKQHNDSFIKAPFDGVITKRYIEYGTYLLPGTAVFDIVKISRVKLVVMLVFLHGLRNAFIVMVAIPLSIVTSFLGMYLLGYTLNIMTLLAMSLVIGILVDDAIVVLENIYRHMEMGKNRIQATLDGRSEISYTAIAITLVDVVVFLPLGLSSGFISAMIGPFALVVVITTLLSLFVAFTAVLLLTSRLAKLQVLKKGKLTGRFYLWFEKQVDNFAKLLQKILVKAMRHKIITFLLVTVLFIGSIMLIPAGFVGTEAFGLGDAGEFILEVELPKEVTLKETNLKVLEIEKLFHNKPEITAIFTTVGASNSGMQGDGVQGNAYKAELDVKLVDKEFRNRSSKVYANETRNELNSKITGAKITAAVMNPFFGSTDDSPVQVIVKSSDQDSLLKYAAVVKDIIERTPGTLDITSSLDNSSNEISVEIDKQKMAGLGLNLATVGSVMSTAFSGNTDTKYSEGSYEYDINVVYDEFNRRNMNDVANLSFMNAADRQVKLSQFAKIDYSNGSTELERYDRNSSITVQSQVLGRASGDVGDEIKRKIETTKFPPQVSIHYAGDMEMSDDAFGTLGFALITAIFLVYLIMVVLYESYLYPFVVLFSIPLAVIGAILALALAKATVSIFSMIGMIMLIGLVAKNAILVVDFTNHLKKQGYRVTRALLEATRLRLRPVLMTTVSMIIGLLPIALASGTASEWKNGIAWVLIGGLTSSMLLTLVLVPVVFLTFENVKVKVSRLLQNREG